MTNLDSFLSQIETVVNNHDYVTHIAGYFVMYIIAKLHVMYVKKKINNKLAIIFPTSVTWAIVSFLLENVAIMSHLSLRSKFIVYLISGLFSLDLFAKLDVNAIAGVFLNIIKQALELIAKKLGLNLESAKEEYVKNKKTENGGVENENTLTEIGGGVLRESEPLGRQIIETTKSGVNKT